MKKLLWVSTLAAIVLGLIKCNGGEYANAKKVISQYINLTESFSSKLQDDENKNIKSTLEWYTKNMENLETDITEIKIKFPELNCLVNQVPAYFIAIEEMKALKDEIEILSEKANSNISEGLGKSIDSFENEINKTESDRDIKTAINELDTSLKKTQNKTDEMVNQSKELTFKFKEKHTELSKIITCKVPEELKELQRRMDQDVMPEFYTAVWKVMQYSTNPKIKEAIEKFREFARRITPLNRDITSETKVKKHVITIKENSEILLDGSPSKTEKIEYWLKQELKLKPDQAISIRASKSLPYSEVLMLVKKINEMGYYKIMVESYNDTSPKEK